MKKKFILILYFLLLNLFLVFPVAGQGVSETSLPRLVDNAGLLTQNESSQLLSTLDEISERQQFDLVIVTVSSIEDGYTIGEYADDIYDYYDFGFGVDKDGALLLICMDPGEMYISTSGTGISVFTDTQIEDVFDAMQGNLSSGQYYEGLLSFATTVDELLSNYVSGETLSASASGAESFDAYASDAGEYSAYDEGDYYGGYYYPYGYQSGNGQTGGLSALWIPVSIIFGVFVASAVTGSMKSRLKNVKFQASASDYTRKNSMNLTAKNDMFLYRHVATTPRAGSVRMGVGGMNAMGGRRGPRTGGGSMWGGTTLRSGGSSIHSSSRGRIHGGGGRRF